MTVETKTQLVVSWSRNLSPALLLNCIDLIPQTTSKIDFVWSQTTPKIIDNRQHTKRILLTHPLSHLKKRTVIFSIHPTIIVWDQAKLSKNVKWKLQQVVLSHLMNHLLFSYHRVIHKKFIQESESNYKSRMSQTIRHNLNVMMSRSIFHTLVLMSRRKILFFVPTTRYTSACSSSHNNFVTILFNNHFI